MGAPGSSCAFMGAHLCSPVFMCFCLVVWLFPTCQVRVVRFYQSCSRLASPPPASSFSSSSSSSFSSSAPPRFLVLHLCLQLANSSPSSSPSSSPTSELSVHRWTSTCDFPSSVCTAGQPGTCPAQCAPLDLNLWTCPAQCGPLDLNL